MRYFSAQPCLKNSGSNLNALIEIYIGIQQILNYCCAHEGMLNPNLELGRKGFSAGSVGLGLSAA